MRQPLTRYAFITLVIATIGCSPAQPIDGFSGVSEDVVQLLSGAKSLTIFHTPSGRVGNKPYEIHDVEPLALIRMDIGCSSNCADYLPAITTNFIENSFVEFACGPPYTTLIRIVSENDHTDIYLSSEGHCLWLDGHTYLAEESLLNGVIGGFPDYFYSADEFGLENFELPAPVDTGE